MKIEFVSYTGSYPNLCGGILTLLIDGTEFRFGHDYGQYRRDGNGEWHFANEVGSPNYDAFWSSGGCCYFDDRNDAVVETEQWRFIKDGVFPKLLVGHEDELIRVFNYNVPYGCCGGCV